MDSATPMNMPLPGAIGQSAALWDLYTLKEEYLRTDHGQYRSFYSSGQDHILEPAVSKHLAENGMQAEYPDQKKFAVCLTHDIDDIYPPLSHMAFSSISSVRKLEMRELAHQLTWKLRGKAHSPYRNFDEIMALEEQYGARSSFYAMATDRDIRRFRAYRVEDLESDLGSVVDKGWEVGLHGGYYAFDDLVEIKLEKDRLEKVLGKKVIGYRNHYLRFKLPETWKYLAEAGFEYDTTLGYSNALGYRNGMCHPFRPYDPILGQEISLCEIPLAIMDGTLFRYYHSIPEMWDAARSVIDAAERYNGVVTLLWHNNIFSSPYRKEWKKMYVKLLDYCHSKNAWMTSGKEVYELWRKNSY